MYFCSNDICHVIASDTLSISVATSSISSIPTLYYTPTKFATVCTSESVPTIPDQDTECQALNVPVSPPSTITYISFDLVFNYLAPVLLRQKYHDLQHLIYESDRVSFSLAKIISPDTAISLTTFNHTLSSLQHRLSLLSTNKSPSSRILPKELVRSSSLWHCFASNSTASNGNTVSKSIILNSDIVSISIAPNGNIVSYSIVSIGKIGSNDIVDKVL